MESRGARIVARSAEVEKARREAVVDLSLVSAVAPSSVIGRHPKQGSFGQALARQFAGFAALAHHNDSVADLRQLFRVARYDQDGASALAQFEPDLVDLASSADVDASRWVEK